MIPLFNIRGYTAYDPLDRMSAFGREALVSAATFAVNAIVLYFVYGAFNISTLRWSWLYWVQCAVLALFYARLVVGLRKSSSFLLMGMLIISMIPVDLYIDTWYRLPDGSSIPGATPALWTYNADGLFGSFPRLVQILLAWLFDGFFAGPLPLWIGRLIAKGMHPKPTEDQPTYQQQREMFRTAWSNETVTEPKHDLSFWILKVLGVVYLIYLLILLLGALGTRPWPDQLGLLMEMTYRNPAMAVSTYMKITIMATLALLGAHNRELRWHTCLVLLVGHLISVVGLLVFYFAVPPEPPAGRYHDLLLASAIADAAMCIAFAGIMIAHKQYADRYAIDKFFPEYYSIPRRFTAIFYYVFGGLMTAMVGVALYFRFATDGSSGFGGIFGYPAPLFCNVLTKFAALAMVAFLIAEREKLREALYKVILWPYAISVIASSVWLLISGFDGVTMTTRVEGADGTLLTAPVGWYLVLNVVLDGAVVAAIIMLRKFYFNVEFSVTALSASSAQNVMSLHDALFGEQRKENGVMVDYENQVFDSSILHSVDTYVAGIHGRKRGLLNFPFWIIEHILPVFDGFRISFSAMDRTERRSFLRRTLLRMPVERMESFVPDFAEIAYKLGNAGHALMTVAHYSDIRSRNETGYVPIEARDRLQGEYSEMPPPFTRPADLPKGPDDPLNNRPETKPTDPARPVIAPRVVTPVTEPDIPDEADYVIIGSGAGGAVMAYRLAKENPNAKILVIERGPRFSPLQDFNDNEIEMIRKVYKEGGLQQTRRFDLMVLQGECVGGSTVVYNAICFPMPDRVRDEWSSDYDIDLSNLSSEYARIADELEIGPLPPTTINQRVKAKFEAGIAGFQSNHPTAENAHVLSGNFRNPLGEGIDNLGNRRMRKRSMLETYIPWAEAQGNTTVVSEVTALRFIGEKGHAEEVMLRTKLGHVRRVKVNKAVVVSGGVIASSHFLMRSGVGGAVGQNVSCNFAFPIAFAFADELKAYDGTQITLGAIDAAHNSIFETYFNPPGAFATALPFFFERQRSMMAAYSHCLNFGALIGSEPNGIIERKADIVDGRAFTWEIGHKDRENIRYALSGLVEIGEAAGALRMMIPTHPGIELDLTKKSDIDDFKRLLATYPLRTDDLFRFVTAHPQGGNMMTGDGSAKRSQGVVGGDFRVRGYDNVFVADASLFPTGITVNPQWTIMAMSSLASRKVIDLCP